MRYKTGNNMIYGIPKQMADNCVEVAEELFDQPRGRVFSRKKFRPLPQIRGIIFTFIELNTGQSFTGIAEACGMSRGTVKDGLELHSDRMTGDRQYKESYEAFCAAYHDKFEEPKLR